MEIRFLGPLGKVTGSCAWLRDERRAWNFIVDCGMQQGEETAKEWNNQTWPFEPKEIKFVILTHAHIDHSGLLPCLYRDGFRGKVYCTEETAEIAKILLKDAANIDDNLFAKADIKKIEWSSFERDSIHCCMNPVDNDLFVNFFRSGHIPGAVSVCIYWGAPKSPEQKRIVFSGDIGPQRQDAEVLPIIRHTMNPGACDYAVLESTYGNKLRDSSERDPEERRQHLRRLLIQAIERNGTLIIPCFALGRSQDVMFDLHAIVAQEPDLFGATRFFLDYPLAQRLNKVISRYWKRMENTGRKVRPAWLGKQVFRLLGLPCNDPSSNREAFKAIDALVTDRDDPDWVPLCGGNHVAAQWKPIFSLKDPVTDDIRSSQVPTVIVTGSGDCQSGKASKWLPELLPDENVIVALTGFCSSGSVGRQLLDIASLPARERELHVSKEITWETSRGRTSVCVANIKATIESIKGYSAHGDQSDLLNWVFQNPGGAPSGRTIFLQHGDDLNREGLRAALTEAASQAEVELEVRLPGSESGWISLEAGAPEDPDARALQDLLARRPDLRSQILDSVKAEEGDLAPVACRESV